MSHEGYGIIRYRSMFNEERILLASPEAMGEVLTTKSYHFKKPAMVVAELKQVTGFGVLLVEGDEHKAQRKALSPAFSYRHIKELYNPMWTIAGQGVDSLVPEVSGRSKEDPYILHIGNWASQVTLGIICVAGLGQEMNSFLKQDETFETIRQSYHDILTPTKYDLLLFLLRNWFLPRWMMRLLPFQKTQKLGQATATLRNVCRKLIDDRKRDLSSEQASMTEKNILTVALSSGFSDDSLVSQMLTFLAAGHETVSISTTWAVYALCLRPEIQKRLRKEIREHLSDYLSPSSTDNMQELSAVIDNHMPYLNAFCKEVNRYHPAVMMSMREAAVNTTIQGVPIPAGTPITIPIRGTNRNKALWGPDADKFNPERYLSQGKQGSAPSQDEEEGVENFNKGAAAGTNYANLTFLHGPRSCIGQSFAKAELAIIIARLVNKFDFALADESQKDENNVELRRGAICRPQFGIKVKVTMASS